MEYLGNYRKEKNMNTLLLMLKNRKGATMAEYAVIAAVLILVAVVAFTSLGTTIVSKINDLVAGM
jgi:Flp pilus assembly pilin Flp